MKKLLFTVLLSLGINSFAMGSDDSEKPVQPRVPNVFALEFFSKGRFWVAMSLAMKAAGEDNPEASKYFMGVAGKTTLEECREGRQEFDSRLTSAGMRAWVAESEKGVKKTMIEQADRSGRQDIVAYLVADSGLSRRSVESSVCHS
jgi:hypothetical protein